MEADAAKDAGVAGWLGNVCADAGSGEPVIPRRAPPNSFLRRSWARERILTARRGEGDVAAS